MRGPDAVATVSGAALADVARALREGGVAAAGREARLLVQGVVGFSAAELLTGDRAWPAGAVAKVWDAVERRRRGEPLAYVLGMAAFRTVTLSVNADVLIPRPETEGLVEHVLRWSARRWGDGPWGSVIDVGTGSGCVALSLAAEGRFATVIATDVSAAALRVAGRNVERAGSPPGAHLLRCFLVQGIRPDGVDVVVSNPPYIATDELARLDRSVRAFEPHEALDGGADGMYHIRALVAAVRSVLRRGGLLAVEIDAGRAETALQFARAAGWPDARIEHDVFGRPRYLISTRE